VQILGAEKALFRALKTKGNTPKYGLIYHSTFIGRADTKNKGRISRYLANKCAIAARIDSFSDAPNRRYGEKLRDQVEERLRFYETGASPRRNIDVMAEVSRELKAAMGNDDDDHDDMDEEMDATNEKTDKKKEKKSEKKDKKKRKSMDNDDDMEESPKKKEKKDKKDKKKKKE
jgi:nucleolar protein 56